MGKPKSNILKKKQKVKQNAKSDQNMHDSEDLIMEDGSDKLLQNVQKKTRNAATPVVLEDIRIISQHKTSKVAKKKDKRKQKKEKLLEKLRSSDDMRLKNTQAIERSKAVIIGDMKPLMDALPSVPNVTDDKHVEGKAKQSSMAKKQKKNWNHKKWKTKRKEELHDVNLFKKVLQLPEYKQDPVCAIANHVEYMVKGELVLECAP